MQNVCLASATSIVSTCHICDGPQECPLLGITDRILELRTFYPPAQPPPDRGLVARSNGKRHLHTVISSSFRQSGTRGRAYDHLDGLQVLTGSGSSSNDVIENRSCAFFVTCGLRAMTNKKVCEAG